MNNEIIVLDIETTGLSPLNDFILELGIVKLNLETGEITALFDKVFKEEGLTARHHKSWIIVNNFMTIEEIRSAQSIEVYREEIQSVFDQFKGRITAWNRSFDSSFLKYNNFELGDDFACPMKESVYFFKIPNSRGYYKWPKAQEAWDILFPGVEKIEEHRGLDDSKMEAKIIHKLYKMGVYNPF